MGNTRNQTELCIIGGGAGGLALAALLAPSGLEITIIDPQKPVPPSKIKPSGRTVALMNASVNILKTIGIWDDLEAYSNALEQMRIFDASDSLHEPVQVEFPANDIGVRQFGFNIPNALLRSVLFAHVKSFKNVTFLEDSFAGYSIEKIDTIIELASKKSIAAKLLVGADGRMSQVRAAADIDFEVKKYDQVALTFLINHSRTHQNISTEFHYESGPMALVPLPGNMSSVVWVERSDKADALIHLKKQDFEAAFHAKTQNVLGGVTLDSAVESWPLCSIKAKRITAERVALIAEAAHVMSPITAQGLNLSLRDVATLAEEIIDAARLGQDIGNKDVLRRYEVRRKADIETRVFGVDAMNRIVSTDMLGLKRLRRAGLKSLDTLPFTKSLAMQIGLAPRLDVGRLLKGEAL